MKQTCFVQRARLGVRMLTLFLSVMLCLLLALHARAAGGPGKIPVKDKNGVIIGYLYVTSFDPSEPGIQVDFRPIGGNLISDVIDQLGGDLPCCHLQWFQVLTSPIPFPKAGGGTTINPFVDPQPGGQGIPLTIADNLPWYWDEWPLANPDDKYAIDYNITDTQLTFVDEPNGPFGTTFNYTLYLVMVNTCNSTYTPIAGMDWNSGFYSPGNVITWSPKNPAPFPYAGKIGGFPLPSNGKPWILKPL